MKFGIGRKVSVDRKQYPLRSVPFNCTVSVPYLYFFLSMTFVPLYSACSSHIQIGVDLKLYTDFNPS